MTGFIEIFEPSTRHLREQRDLEKILIIEQDKGGSGPKPLDIDSGSVEIVMPVRPGRTKSALSEDGRAGSPQMI